MRGKCHFLILGCRTPGEYTELAMSDGDDINTITLVAKLNEQNGQNAVEKILGAILYLTRSDIKGYEDANYILYQLAGKPMEWFPDGAMRHNLDIVEDILLLSAEVTEAFKDLD